MPASQPPGSGPPGRSDARGRVDRMLAAALMQDDLHAVFLADPDGKIFWANPAAEQIFGYALEDVLGKPLDILFLPEDRMRGIPQFEREAARAFQHSEDDRWQVRADGSAFWATGTTNAVFDDESQLIGYAKIMRNRTDLRQQLLALRNERDALLAARNETAEALAKGAHELRNPLSVMSNATTVLQQLVGDTDARVSRTAGMLQRQVQQVARLTDDLLESNRAGGDDRPGRVGRVTLQDAVDETVQALATGVSQRERITVLAPEAPIALFIDAVHLQQILSNLIGNAIKYTPDGRPIRVRMSVEDGEAVVRVEDDGVGIAPDELASIFGLFTRASPPLEMPGSGIGLAVVRELVMRYMGTVMAQSEGVGRGALFTVRLPVAPDHALPDQAELVSDRPVH